MTIRDFYLFKVCDHVSVDSNEYGELLVFVENPCSRCRQTNFYFDYSEDEQGNPNILPPEKKAGFDLFRHLLTEIGSDEINSLWGTGLQQFIGEKNLQATTITRIKDTVSQAMEVLINLQRHPTYSPYLDENQLIVSIESINVDQIAETAFVIRVQALLSNGQQTSSLLQFNF